MMHRNLWLALSLSLAACNYNETLLHSYKSLPSEGWYRRDTICFDLPKAEENINGTLIIGLRTTSHIGIKDVVLAVEQCNETGIISRCDTIHYPLTDAEGKGLGEGVNILQYETEPLSFRLQKNKQGYVRIHHLMTQETLTGITEIGIKVKK